ncbi:uncharacterized protein LOC142229888 [Haematobia irritans]|uniref:uncharacterized protein LOC142229888 n=1 Tax=Haematobia irritans TaxID=7368 RepID=UPI003F50C820
MPKSPSRPKFSGSKVSKAKSYTCHLCNFPHPLRTCRRFLKMNVNERLSVVQKRGYCINCLAHEHSHGRCFSTSGCRICHSRHHTLLHPLSTRRKETRTKRSRSPTSAASQSTATSVTRPSGPIPGQERTSLSSLMRQNSVVLLPTVLVRIDSRKKESLVRCLLDSGSPFSRISRRVVEAHKLTTLTLQDETLCPLVLRSRFDSSIKIETTLRVDNRIAMKTPSKSLSESFKENFPNLLLADSGFFESSPIDIVLGVDWYPKIVSDGSFSRPGLPTAMSTIFGWVIYGASSF